VPDGWEIDTTALSAFSTVKDTRERGSGIGDQGSEERGRSVRQSGPAPRLVLRGIVMMGAVEIAS
jgi:hypothetical protein